jgi:hypothetical protein
MVISKSFSLFLVVAAAAIAGAGCMTVPDRYRAPLRVYEPEVASGSVYGFRHTEYRATGASPNPTLRIEGKAPN